MFPAHPLPHPRTHPSSSHLLLLTPHTIHRPPGSSLVPPSCTLPGSTLWAWNFAPKTTFNIIFASSFLFSSGLKYTLLRVPHWLDAAIFNRLCRRGGKVLVSTVLKPGKPRTGWRERTLDSPVNHPSWLPSCQVQGESWRAVAPAARRSMPSPSSQHSTG